MTMHEDLIEKAAKAIGDASEDGNWLQMDEVLREWCRRDARAVLAVFEDAWSHEHTVNVSREDWERLKRIEAAQAPTDDEREALANLIPLDLVHDAGREGFPRNAFEAADRIIASDVWRSRRPVSPEPSAVACAWCASDAHGTAIWQGTDRRHPSCGTDGHGFEFVRSEPQTEPTEHPAHSGHKFGGAYARASALVAGDPDWTNATGGEPQGEPPTVQLMARRGGKTQALIESMLAQANDRGIRVEIIYSQTEPTDAQLLAALNAKGHAESKLYEFAPDLEFFTAGSIYVMRAALRAAAETTNENGSER